MCTIVMAVLICVTTWNMIYSLLKTGYKLDPLQFWVLYTYICPLPVTDLLFLSTKSMFSLLRHAYTECDSDNKRSQFDNSSRSPFLSYIWKIFYHRYVNFMQANEKNVVQMLESSLMFLTVLVLMLLHYEMTFSMECVHPPQLGPFCRSSRHISSTRHTHLSF